MALEIAVTQNMPFQQLAQVTALSGTATGALGPGSSLFLQRLFLPGLMVLTEVDLALGIAFPGAASGAGTMNHSLVIYGFGNRISLGSPYQRFGHERLDDGLEHRWGLVVGNPIPGRLGRIGDRGVDTPDRCHACARGVRHRQHARIQSAFERLDGGSILPISVTWHSKS